MGERKLPQILGYHRCRCFRRWRSARAGEPILGRENGDQTKPVVVTSEALYE
jgi:hypothetical protein